MRCYIKAFQNYLNNDGRASRKELWWFFVIHCIMIFLLSMIDGFFGLYLPGITYGVLTLVYLAFSFLPAVCVQVRRLHDVNESGWWWIGFHVPLVSLYVLYLYLKRGSSEVNVYGVPTERKKTNKKIVEQRPKNRIDDNTKIETKMATDSLNMKGFNQRVLYCRKCGFKLIEDSSFCSKCGTEIVEI